MKKLLLCLAILCGTVMGQAVSYFPQFQKGTIAQLPASCVIGQWYFATNATAGQNAYYCTASNTWTQQLISGGGGASSFYQLTDFGMVKTSGTIETIGTGCSSSAPCQLRVGSVVYLLTSAPTVTISGSSASDTVYWYLSSSQVLTAGYNGVETLTGSGITTASGITGFPSDSIPLWTTTITSNVWNAITEAMDQRAIMGRAVIAPGSGVSSSADPTTGIQTLSTDPTIMPRYFTGSGAPSSNCTAGRDFYTDTTGLDVYFCDATNTWKKANGGSSSYPPITPGTYYEYDAFCPNNAGVSGGAGLLNWYNISNNGIDVYTSQTATATSLCGVQIATGAVSTNDAQKSRGANSAYLMFHTGESFTLRTSVIGVTSDANTTYRFGLADTYLIGNSQPNNGVYIEGSEQEFDGRPISCGFPESDEFGLGDRHALSFEEQVA